MDPTAIASIAGQGIGDTMNMFGTLLNNIQSQKFSEKMYNRQFEDNVRFWNMQNAYNAPAEQMKRLKAAGLNPNLIYGKAEAGGMATPIKTPDVQPVNYRPLDFGRPLASIGALFDYEIKQAQLDNLKAQNQVIAEDVLLKAAQRKNYEANTGFTTFRTDFEQQMQEVSADARREKLRQMRAQTDYSIDENVRREVLTASNLTEAAERVKNLAESRLNMRQQRAQSRAEVDRIRTDISRMNEQIDNLIQDGTLKRLEIEMRKNGMTFSDPLWSRIVAKLLMETFSGEDGSIFGTALREFWKDLGNPGVQKR